MTPELAMKYGLDEAERQARKDFLGLSADDETGLRGLQNCFARIAASFAETFYRHLTTSAETGRYLNDPELVQRLKQAQMQYFRELLAGEFGQEYFEKRLSVGEVHQRLGIEPTWYLGAYNLYIQICFPRFAEEFGVKLPVELLSLIKVIFLDVGLALETYFAEATEQLRRRNEQVEHALQMYLQTEIKAQQYAKLAGHEIRGTLNAVANVCEEVVEDFGDRIPEEAGNLLRSAHGRLWQLAKVVDGILSAPEHAGAQQWVETGELLKEVAGRMNLYSPDSPVELTLPAAGVKVWADPIALREVFANLVSNAVHHLDKPRGRVCINHQETGSEHIFTVADNGPGIPAELQHQVFQPFFRIPRENRPQGRGLGLYFVRSLVEQHGGKVWVESVVGQGSRFSFSIPKQPPVSLPSETVGGT
jgi:signal transduction histidine kinase